MSTSTNIDYIDTYFQIPVLTKIHGEPTYHTLKILKNELKANASSVQSNLGGGSHGHLGLVLTRAEYALIAIAPYINPPHPGQLNIAPGTANHEAERLTREHRELVREWRETVDIEKALIKQIVKAIEPNYLKALRNTTTNTITQSVNQILTYLFDCYGLVEYDELMGSEAATRLTVFDPSQPITILYDAIEDLRR